MATITWASGVSGSWSVAADWIPELVPGSGDTAEIGPGTSADASWVVTATNEAASSLLLDAGDFGTLAITDALVIGSLLSMAGGTLLGTSAARISSVSLIQSGGAVTLDGGTLTDGAGGADSPVGEGGTGEREELPF